MRFFGYTLDQILLILTTAVSLEAIYLAIFIQMTVNKTTQSLEQGEEDIDEIQEDVEDIQEDVDEIQEDVDEGEKTDRQLLQSLLKEVKTLRQEVNQLYKK